MGLNTGIKMITLYLLPLLLLSVIPAYIAQTKGKSFGAWYVYGLFLLPITFVHSLILDRDDRKCPHCAELVKLEATVCKHYVSAHDVGSSFAHAQQPFPAQPNHSLP